MNYFIEILSIKPKNDINEIVKRLGIRPVTAPIQSKNAVARFLNKLWNMMVIPFRLGKGDTLFIQYPFKKFFGIACFLAHLRGAKVVTLIHDLGSFRRHKLTVRQENDRLMQSDVLIVHNPSMQQFVVENGYTHPIVTLGIFDYLSTSSARERKAPAEGQRWRVSFAGNLTERRNHFLYELDPLIGPHWQMELYGHGMTDEDCARFPNMHFHGRLPEDQLVSDLDAEFGLVWGGDSATDCVGDWGVYLGYNNPHKTSFSMRAGLPVIIWSKAAMADFVLSNGIGLVVDSLADIEPLLANLSAEDYARMHQNAMKIGKQLQAGKYTEEALKKAYQAISSFS
jgi:glycosyltransferase involved in cell wall biosynthesis